MAPGNAWPNGTCVIVRKGNRHLKGVITGHIQARDLFYGVKFKGRKTSEMVKSNLVMRG